MVAVEEATVPRETRSKQLIEKERGRQGPTLTSPSSNFGFAYTKNSLQWKPNDRKVAFHRAVAPGSLASARTCWYC